MNLGGTLRINKFACFTLGFIIFLIVYWHTSSASQPLEKSDLINLKYLLNAAIYAAERGGRKVVEGRKNVDVKSKGETLEGVNDVVTNADYQSHCAMYYSLKYTFPKVDIVSEEHSTKESECESQEPINVDSVPSGEEIINSLVDELVYTKDVTIWIDPLDATKEYTENLLEYVTTMVCVAVKGVPVIGVIHYPFSPKTYWGWITKRTSQNIREVFSKGTNKNAPKVVISRSHSGEVAKVAKEAFGEDTKISEAAGAGFKVMTVVDGTNDLYLHTTVIKKWDLCAGNAIIRAVNGNMTVTSGESIDYSNDGNYAVKGGILVSRFDFNYYLGKFKNVMAKH